MFLIYVIRKMDIFRWIFRIQFFEKCLEQISLANLFIYFSAHTIDRAIKILRGENLCF